jgi:hypothetical protein
MRALRFTCALLAMTCLCSPVVAQPAEVDVEVLAAAARDAAAAAERAAQAAREAANAAERARQALRAAGRSGDPIQNSPGQDEQVAENLPVGRPVTPAERAQADLATRQARQTGLAQGVANGPNDRLLRSSTTPEIQITATTKDKIATLAWTLDVSGAPSAGALSMTQMTFTAATSLDSQGEAQIVGLRGFPGGTELKLNLIHYFGSYRASATERPQEAQARRICLVRLRQERPTATEAELNSACDPTMYPGGVGVFVAHYNPDQYREMVRDALPGEFYFVGAEATANQTDFNYLDQPSFSMQSVSHFGYTGTIFAGVVLSEGQTSISGSFTYGRRYRARDSITLCQPINAIPQTQCMTAPAGPPTRRNQAIASVEFRHAFGAAVGQYATIAIAPELSVDFNRDSYSADLPIYLVGDGQGVLRGGIRLGYVNSPRDGGGRDDDFSLGIFIGVPFSVFR